ncbi:MAG TPA: hypothetical protein VFW05_04745 [Verrucomicrobiae bacterium]|nr:hypothetical protein [Verrucomicrobiae bacterium]
MEIVLLLRDSMDRRWTASEVYQKVRSSERSVSYTLDELARRGLLARIDQPQPLFQFAPRTPELRTAIDELARLYSERRVRIVEAIYSLPISAVDEFAKAFRLRKDPHA